MAASLLEIPPEIFEMILGLLDTATYVGWKAISNLRGVNKALCTSLTPAVFKAIPFWMSLESLENLTNIAAHPRLRHHVTKLTFSPLRFTTMESPSPGARKILQSKGLNGNLSDLSVAKYIQSLTGYRAGQDELDKNETGETMLRRIFAEMPNVTIFEIHTGNPCIGAKQLSRNLGICERGLFRSDCRHTLEMLTRVLAFTPWSLQEFRIWPATSHFPLRKSHHMDRPYQVIGEVLGSPFSLDAFSTASFFQPFPRCKFLDNITTLSLLNIGHEGDVLYTYYSSDFAKYVLVLNTMLRYSPKIQDLEIGWSNNVNQRLGDVWYAIKGLPLKRLYASGFAIGWATGFESIMRSIAPTIETIEIAYPSIIPPKTTQTDEWHKIQTDEWHKILTEMRQLSSRRLKSFESWDEDGLLFANAAGFITEKETELPKFRDFE